MVVKSVNVRENWVRGYRNSLCYFCSSSVSLKSSQSCFFFKDLVDRAYNFSPLLADVTLPRLKAFIPQLLSRLHIEALLHGNITKQVGD